MTWTRTPAGTWCLEAMPLDAACMVDLVRGNCDHLMREPPACNGMYWINGAPTSLSTVYDADSTVWRSPLTVIRSAIGNAPRSLTCRVAASMNAGTGSVRFCASAGWRIVEYPARDGDNSVESAAGAIVSTSAANPTIVTLTMVLSHSAVARTDYGTRAPERAATMSRAAYLSLQAIAAPTRTITVHSFTLLEVDP